MFSWLINFVHLCNSVAFIIAVVSADATAIRVSAVVVVAVVVEIVSLFLLLWHLSSSVMCSVVVRIWCCSDDLGPKN